MFEIFLILIWFPVILVTSYFVKKVLLCHDLGPFESIINTLRYIGVVVHELSHFLMCLLVGVHPRGIVIRLKNEMTHETDPHGAVFHDSHDISFLQSALIALAPTIVSTWLFFWSLDIALTPFDPLIRILAGFFCLTLLLGAAPSVPDFRNIGRSFKKSPQYSIYQIVLVVTSGFVVWGILIHYHEIILYDLIYFVFVGIAYAILKYSFMGIKIFIYTIYSKDRTNSTGRNFKKFTQKRFKPSKPYKSGKEEAHW